MQLAQKAPVIANTPNRKTKPSPLTGKLFDEHGMRLAPSHTRKNGERYRYYVSRDLVTGRKDDSRSRGWRLPADKLEAFVKQAVQRHLRDNANVWIAQSRNVEADRQLQRHLADQGWMLETIERAVIGEGNMSIILKPEPIVTRLDLPNVSIDASALTFDTTFTMRRRGVEARFVSGGTAPERDTSLIANIARATQWLEWIKSGRTLDQIAETEKTTKKRVQQTLNFAFLAPDIVRDVLAGRQPTGLTSTWVATHELPTDWNEQRSLIARL